MLPSMKITFTGQQNGVVENDLCVPNPKYNVKTKLRTKRNYALLLCREKEGAAGMAFKNRKPAGGRGWRVS